jgi:hypothetical protein
LEIDPENEKLLGPCACCGEMTSRVWGYAYRSDVAIAAYFVEWTPLHTVVDAMFDLIIGTWGEGTLLRAQTAPYVPHVGERCKSVSLSSAIIFLVHLLRNSFRSSGGI